MSRLQKAARSLVSGYAAMASNVLYSLASFPLALHYLGKEQYGIWAVATGLASYLLLIDAGVSGAVGRFLIDCKDDQEGGDYGSLIKTGCLVFLVQGAAIAVGGSVLSIWLPAISKVPVEFVPVFRVLVSGQCVILGGLFIGRILTSVLQAHHRFDVMNFSGIVQFVVGFGVQWLTFHLGWGLYSLLAASAAASFCGSLYNLIFVIRLHLFPEKNWGRSSMKVFKEVFSYGNDLFLMMLGLQLLNATQVIIISRTQGPVAVTVWSAATKSFLLAFQFVQKVFDFSGTVLGEMIVRGERDLLRRRYRDILLLTASLTVFSAISVVVCNASFVWIWTAPDHLGWPFLNDCLMGVLLLFNCITRCQIGLSGYAKERKTMRWIYFLEGVTFATTAFLVAPRWGIPGIIVAAIAANIAWSGAYGFRWAARYLEADLSEFLKKSLTPAIRYLLALLPIAAAIWWATKSLPQKQRFTLNSTAMTIAGLSLFWFLGLTPTLRGELASAARRVFRR